MTATMMAEETSAYGYDNWEEFNFHQSDHKVNPAWILLDNCSTTNIFCNKKLLTNIRPSHTTLKIHCNAGTKEVNQFGTLKNYGTVWYSDGAIANILSLSRVKEKIPITYDSKNDNKFHVVKPDKHVVFKESDSGLYYHDTADRAFLMLNANAATIGTIKASREGFTDRDYERAKQARKALALIGYPSPKDFKHMVSSNMIKNCPVTSTDVANANTIFGPDLATLKGKTVRITPPPVATDYVQIPNEIMSLNRNVTLAIDIMFVNGLPFLVSISRKIKSTTVEYLIGRKQHHLVNSIKKIVNLYKQRGFTIETALMDREFECLRGDLPELNLNTTAASEHVPDVERQIRVLKERSRAIRSTLPFKAIPGRIIIELVYYAAFWLNAFPPSSGVSAFYSPRTIMTGMALDFENHCKLPFGAYAEAHEEYPQTNTMAPRARGVICLGPTGNFQGSYKMMCHQTGRKLTRKQFQELPMSESIIKRIEAITEKEKQEKLLFSQTGTKNRYTMTPPMTPSPQEWTMTMMTMTTPATITTHQALC
jgi:hypothetical protein